MKNFINIVLGLLVLLISLLVVAVPCYFLLAIVVGILEDFFGVSFSIFGVIALGIAIFIIFGASIFFSTNDESSSISNSSNSNNSGNFGEPFVDGSGRRKNPGEQFVDGSGSWRNPGEPFVDGSGSWRNPGEPFVDGSGRWRNPGDQYVDGGGNWRNSK